MRCLVVEAGPSFSVQDVVVGWTEGLVEAGQQVVQFNLNDRLGFYACAMRETTDGRTVRLVNDEGAARLASKGIESACFEWLPDFVLIVSCFFVPPDILDIVRARGIKVVLVHTESPYEDDRQLERAAHADLNLLNDPTNLERFQAVAPSVYMPHAYRPSLHCPGPVEPKLTSDFAFVGTGYRSRVDLLEAVDWSDIDVALGGNWTALDEDSPLRRFLIGPDDCMDNADTVRHYRATKSSANLYRQEADRPELAQGWAMGPREVELAATGTFFLRQSRGEGDEVLPSLPTFDGADDLGSKLRWWLAHDKQRKAAAQKARAAIADRTFANHARQLLRRLTG